MLHKSVVGQILEFYELDYIIFAIIYFMILKYNVDAK